METSLEFINCKVCWKLIKKKSVNHTKCFQCMMIENEKYEEILRLQSERNKLLVESRKND